MKIKEKDDLFKIIIIPKDQKMIWVSNNIIQTMEFLFF